MNIISTNNAIYTGSSYSVTFGGGFDLSCYDNQNCYSNLGNTYQLPSFLTMYSQQAQSFLGGNYSFSAVEIEVYSIFIDRKLH